MCVRDAARAMDTPSGPNGRRGRRQRSQAAARAGELGAVATVHRDGDKVGEDGQKLNTIFVEWTASLGRA